jgi:hypothetical protein
MEPNDPGNTALHRAASAAIPGSLDALLTRADTGAALRAAGYPVADSTLATKATRGGGPPYHRFGIRPLYRWGEALAWAQSRLSASARSTSEHEAACSTQKRQRSPSSERETSVTSCQVASTILEISPPRRSARAGARRRP